MKAINLRSKSYRFLELIIDTLIIAFSIYIITFSHTLIMNNILILSFIIINDIFLIIYNESIIKEDFSTTLIKICLSAILSYIIIITIDLVFNEFNIDIFGLTIAILVYITIMIGYKYVLYIYLKNHHIKKSLLIGPRDSCLDIAKKMLVGKERYTRLSNIYYQEDYNIDILNELIDQNDYIYIHDDLKDNLINTLIELCISKNKIVFIIPSIYNILLVNSNIDKIEDILIFESGMFNLNILQKIMKRIFDIIVSFIVILISLPIFLIIPIFIKIDSRGPVLFHQKRLTKNNKIFSLVKYRTMIEDAEKETGAVIASTNDERITKLGKVLRKFRIDEIPQIFNVLLGDMSIVGPRPERLEFVKEFSKENKFYNIRGRVKAGITGLAQVMGYYDTTYFNKLKFDLLYIRNYSFLLDIKILLHTAVSIFDFTSSKGLSENYMLEDILSHYGVSMHESKGIIYFKYYK